MDYTLQSKSGLPGPKIDIEMEVVSNETLFGPLPHSVCGTLGQYSYTRHKKVVNSVKPSLSPL